MEISGPVTTIPSNPTPTLLLLFTPVGTHLSLSLFFYHGSYYVSYSRPSPDRSAFGSREGDHCAVICCVVEVEGRDCRPGVGAHGSYVSGRESGEQWTAMARS